VSGSSFTHQRGTFDTSRLLQVERAFVSSAKAKMFCKYLKINNTNCHNALIKFFNQNHESALFHCQASADLALF